MKEIHAFFTSFDFFLEALLESLNDSFYEKFVLDKPDAQVYIFLSLND
jgi:hypothetical protein